MAPAEAFQEARTTLPVKQVATAPCEEMTSREFNLWRAALSKYDLALRVVRPTQNRTILMRLDALIYTNLPLAVSARNPRYIMSDEYVFIVEWKLRREKWRPQSLEFSKRAEDDDVKGASLEAFQHLQKGEIGDAFDALLPLPGSSPSIASAILSIGDKTIPFMSYELMQSTKMKKINFFRSTFLRIVEVARMKARYLSRYDTDRTWTAIDVERAAYACANLPQEILEDQTGVEVIDAQLTVATPTRNLRDYRISPAKEASAIPRTKQAQNRRQRGGRANRKGNGGEITRPKRRTKLSTKPRQNVEVLTAPVDVAEDGLENGNEDSGLVYAPRLEFGAKKDEANSGEIRRAQRKKALKKMMAESESDSYGSIAGL